MNLKVGFGSKDDLIWGFLGWYYVLNCWEIAANFGTVGIFAFLIAVDHMNILNRQQVGPFFGELHNIEEQMPDLLAVRQHSVHDDESQFLVYLKHNLNTIMWPLWPLIYVVYVESREWNFYASKYLSWTITLVCCDILPLHCSN